MEVSGCVFVCLFVCVVLFTHISLLTLPVLPALVFINHNDDDYGNDDNGNSGNDNIQQHNNDGDNYMATTTMSITVATTAGKSIVA